LLWRLRASNILMRSKAPVALTLTLVCLQLCAVPLLAKPTRSLARPAVRRQIVAQPMQRLSRERTARSSAGKRSGAHVQSHAVNLSRYAGPTAPHTVTSRRHASTPSLAPKPEAERVHAWMHTLDEQQRSFAAPAYRAGSFADGSSFDRSRLGATEEQPVLLPSLRVSSLYDSSGRLLLPPPLYGSREILLHQNQMADRDGLDRIRDEAGLLDLRRQHQLVALPENEALRVDSRLPQDRRFSRPWTAVFLSVLARDFYAAFQQPLQVDSAVRTVQFQKGLERHNGNAAPPSGDTASPHLTGQAVDIAKRGLTITEIAWMRTYLQPLIDQGKIDVEEEFQQACFHISVYKSFVPADPAGVSLAASH